MTDTDHLRGKVALVTGAARSLGADIVRRLAGDGAHVIVNYFHSVEQAKLLEAELEQAGHSFEFVRASVAKTGEIDRMFDLVGERHAGLDILINNAAGGAFLPLLEIDDTYWQRAWSTNVMAAYHCSRRAAELMVGRENANIVCLSSVGAHLPIPGYGPGGVTKAAMESLVRYLALELRTRGIRVNAVQLGTVHSDFVDNLDDPAALRSPAEVGELMSRALSTPEAAKLIAHLLHPDSAFVTGQTVVADGGISIGGMQGVRLHSRLADRVGVPARSRPVAPSSTSPEANEPSVDTPEPLVTKPPPTPVAAPDPAPDQAPSTDPEAVAVVGLGLVLPGANSTDEFWDRLREGTLIRSEPSAFDLTHFWAPTREDTDAFYVREAGYVQTFVPDPASITEPDGNVDHPGWPRTNRWLRHCAVRALAGVRRRPTDRCFVATTGIHDQTGLGPQAVVLGDEYRRMVREAVPADQEGDWLAELADHAINAHYAGDGGNPQAYLPASVSRNALRGLIPDDAQHLTLDSACASGLFALDAAVKALRDGSCDVAFAGGTSVIEPIGFTLFCRAQGISMSGDVRPFDQAADGTVIGEGAVMLVLKPYARAVADGDPVLGVVRGSGLAADGRGKGIHAPATRGQESAIARAWADAGVEADDVDWIVAHGTGTPVGDEIELRSLLSRLGPRRRACLVTSNKQVFGHTGVLAGLVSVAHALVAFEREAIPGQCVVTDPHPVLGDGSRLTVPLVDAPWPTDDTRPRVVGVSAFGLGGADAHVVLADRVPQAAPATRRGGADIADTEDLVVVGWNTHLPGLDPADVPAWLTGGGPHPEAGFGLPYPLPSPRQVRIPPLTMRHMDAAHLMTLQALGPLLDRLGEPGHRLRPTTAVVVGSSLPTTHNTRAALRVHAAECATAFDILPDPEQAQRLKEYLAKGMAEAAGVIPGDLNEDDFTGAVSCILSGRAANYYDFRGMGVSVYAHRDSAHTGVDLALRQLRHRACDLALVGAVCLRPISGWDRHLAHVVPKGRSIAEGAAVLAIARRSTAREHELPILGTLSTALTGDDRTAAPAHTLPVLTDAGRTYLSLDAVLKVLAAVVTGTDTVVTPAASGSPPIRFTPPTTPRRTPSHKAAEHTDRPERKHSTRAGAAPKEHTAPQAHSTPNDTTPNAHSTPGHTTPEPHATPDRAEPNAHSEQYLGRRQTIRLVPTASPPAATTPAIPPGTVVITDSPDLAAAAAGPDVAVWAPTPGIGATTHVSPEEAPTALARLAFVPRHVRILTRLPEDDGSPDGDGTDDAETARMEALQDLTFTTVQGVLPALRNGGSLAAALLGAIPDDLPSPSGALIVGLVRSVRAEIRQCGGAALLTDTPDAATALARLARAAAAQVPTHTLACRAGTWLTMAVVDDSTAPTPTTQAQLPPGAVVVAFGGARGITPEIMHALASAVDRPHVYVVGRTPPPEPGETLPAQAEFIIAGRRERPDASVGELRADYEKAQARLEVGRTMRRLADLCGADRVHHRVCDVLDAERTTAVLGEVLDRHGHIDLLVNTVLELRSRALHAKTLDDFRAVRATKATGYRNLKRALAGRPPRTWVNFSTLAALAPAPGDVDYCTANEYLAYASARARRHAPPERHEFAILWSGWLEAGVASSVTMRETLKRNRMDAYIDNALGCAQFLAAVARPPAGGVTFFVRAEERTLLHTRGIAAHGSPDDLPMPAPDVPPPAAPDPGLSTPLLDGVLQRGTNWIVLTKTWDPRTLAEQDGRWMRHHRVNGAYTLPGTFTLEAAAGAAALLCPELVVTGFRDLVCRTSITVGLTGAPRTVAVEARITNRHRDHAEVAVRMTTHRIGRNGHVLRFNDPLCETKVRLARRYPTLDPPPDTSSHVPEPDFAMPVYTPDPPISLTGPFAGTRDYARGPDGNSASYRFDHVTWAPALAGAIVPAILLDAMVHLLLLPPADELPPRFGPMAGLGEVDLGGPGNDCRLGAEHPTIDLHCDFATGVLTAAADGRMLARIASAGAHDPDHHGELVRPFADIRRSTVS
ncbi:SDR family oxidoreductase [Streptomyces sp. SID3343]|uniref:SDR family oxidoreductase n=1 Tax=Streptomyces sp. SID3343 TaxID=2690260 RepID=UPI001370AFF6|nr:SDR family oxidoreductase [Streptomyces sp. SID3343]MYW01784.1 SDR family oxidoreductase [Streptomyces sp. SID3343]